MTLNEKLIILTRSGLTRQAAAVLLGVTDAQVAAELKDPATPDPAPAGGGGGGATHVVSAVAQVDHGLPPVALDPGDHGLLLTPEITVEGFAVVEVTGYVEIDSQGGWWTPAIVDNGVSVMTDEAVPESLGSATLAMSGFGFLAWTSRGIFAGEANAGQVTVLNTLHDQQTDPGNIIVLPAGTHNLAIGVPTDLNAASVTGGPPNVIARNAFLAVTVLS